VAYPPTPHNIKLMTEATGQRMVLSRIGPQLEGGIVVRTDASQAIYLPNGCLHAVFTTTGGYLVALDFTTPISAKAYETIINEGFDLVDDREDIIWDAFSETIHTALANNRIDFALKAWINVEERVKEHAGDREQWRATSVENWDQYLKKAIARKQVCPCGGMTANEKFPAHFRANHAISAKKATSVAKRVAVAPSAGNKRKRGAVDSDGEASAAKKRKR
jgi:hypothetical protein